jgi:transposase
VALPARPLRPVGAIWQQFRRWRAKGVWEKALSLLRKAARTKAGRDPEQSMVMLDCQTVKGGRGGPGFHEAGGKYGGTFGAKRTVLIDYLGLPVAARVDSARPHDSKTGRTLLDHSLPGLPWVGEVLADLGCEPLVEGIQRRHRSRSPPKGGASRTSPRGSTPSDRGGRSRTASPSLAAGGASPAATRPPPSRPPPGSTRLCRLPAHQALNQPNNHYGAPSAAIERGSRADLPALLCALAPARGSIVVAGFPELSSAFAASTLGVAQIGTDQLARIVEHEPSPSLAT